MLEIQIRVIWTRFCNPGEGDTNAWYRTSTYFTIRELQNILPKYIFTTIADFEPSLIFFQEPDSDSRRSTQQHRQLLQQKTQLQLLQQQQQLKLLEQLLELQEKQPLLSWCS